MESKIMILATFNIRGKYFHNCTPFEPGIIEDPAVRKVITEIRTAGKNLEKIDIHPDEVGQLHVVRGDDNIARIFTTPADITTFAYKRWSIDKHGFLENPEIVGDLSLFLV